MIRFFTLLVCCVLLTSAGAEEKAPPKITFDEHVKPIFQQKCFACHNPDKKSSDLDLTTYSNLMAGGAAGASIEPGDSSASYLYSLVTHADEPAMPPESPKLPDAMIEIIRQWIDGGVLENSGSEAKAAKKKKFDMALSTPATAKPEVIPMPARLSLQPVIQPLANTAIDALATSPWAPLAAVGGQKQVLLYNTQTLELAGVLPFPEGTPRVLKFSRNGSLLLAGGGVGGASGRVVVWSVRSGQRIIEVGEELDEVLAADISSDQTLVALGGPQRVVRIYSTETGQLMHEIRKHTDWVTSLEFSPDSVLLASGDRNGGMFVWEAWTGREYLTLNGHTASINDVSWRSDSSILASGSEDSTIKLWEMENGGQVKSWGAHGGGVASLEFTRDGRLVSSGRDKTPKLWDQNGGQQRAFEAFADVGLNVSYCDETNRAIAGDWTGEIRVWNAADGARLGGLLMNAPTLQARLAAATQTLVAKQNEHKPIAEAYQTAQAEAERIQAEFAAATKLVADTKLRAEQSKVTLVAVKEQLATSLAQRDALTKQLEAVNTTVPVLRDAADKAAAAAEKVADDPALATAAQTFKTAADAKTAQQQTLTKASQEMAGNVEKMQKEMAASEKVATDNTAAATAAEQQHQKLMPLVKPAEDKAVVAKQSFDQSAAALAAAQQAVARWNDEIAFTQKLDELNSQLKTAGEVLEERESDLAAKSTTASEATAMMAKTNADLATAQAELTKNKADYSATLTATEAAKQAEQKATEMLTAANANVASLQQVTAALKQSLAGAEQAAAIAKEDASITAAVNQLKALMAEKAKQIEAANVEVVSKTKSQQDAKANVAASEQLAAATLAAQAPIEQRVAKLTAEAAALQPQVTAAVQASEASAKSVAEAQQQVDQVKQSIAVAQGIEPTA